MQKDKKTFKTEQLAEIARLEKELLGKLADRYANDLHHYLSRARSDTEFEGLLSKFYRERICYTLDRDFSDINIEINQLEHSMD